MAKQLRIKSCQSTRLWYAGMVGQVVPMVKQDSNGYWATEHHEYGSSPNIILFQDAEVIEDDTSSDDIGTGGNAWSWLCNRMLGYVAWFYTRG